MEGYAFPDQNLHCMRRRIRIASRQARFANRCPSCSEPDAADSGSKSHKDEIDRKNESEMNAERRRVIRDMLYKKDS